MYIASNASLLLKMTCLLSCLFTIGVCSVAQAQETLDLVLIDESFASEEIPKSWQGGGRKGSFTIVDGHLRGVANPDDSHGPSIGVPISAKDVTIEFDVKFAKRNGYFLFLLDGDSQFQGQAHLLRCALTSKYIQLSQDRGDPKSKTAQKKQRDANSGKRTKPTKEELDDPSFYRVEALTRQKATVNDGQWHHVKIDVTANKVTAWLDKGDAIEATGTVLNVPKSRLVFLVGQSGDIRIDNVKLLKHK